jgi:hypothetical protein
LGKEKNEKPGRQTKTKEDKMKKIILLGMVLMTTLVSLGGCFVGYPDHERDRDGRHDRGDRHDHDRGERYFYDRDGGHDERR